jgi:type VI secretion system protein ImpJ
MEPLRPVFWGQGMFLEPQHFQQQDWYHDTRLRRYMHLLIPFGWGVKSLTINEAALHNFIFQIEQCEVITWDGTILRFRGDAVPSNARIEPRSVEQELDPSGRPLAAYLGLRRLQPEGNNVKQPAPMGGRPRSGADGTSHTRYYLEAADASDLCGAPDQRCEVQYMSHDVHILFDVPVARSQDYELVKIAEVLRAADGKGAILSKRYIPPAVSIRSSSVLETIVRDVRDLLTAKGRELSEFRRRRGGGDVVELGSRDVGLLLLAQTVNRYIPVLHHDLEAGEIHPYAVYGQLRQIVGELSTFSGDMSVLGARGEGEDLPPYRHDQLWPCFDMAAQRIGELLAEITTGPVGEVLLRYDGDYFSAALDEPLFAGDNRYYLAIKSDLSPVELSRILQDTGKITTLEDMPKLEKSFLFGLKIDVLESPPEELLMKAHYRYFLIDRRSEHWAKIQERRTMAVYCPSLPPETEVRLVVVFGK